MLTKRIIPCLDIKNGRTVKGINFVDLIDAGKLNLDPLISKVLSLDEVPAILNQPPADGDIKYIVKP